MTRFSKTLIVLWILLTVAFVISLFKVNLVLFILNVIYGVMNTMAVFGMIALLIGEHKNNKDLKIEDKDEL